MSQGPRGCKSSLREFYRPRDPNFAPAPMQLDRLLAQVVNLTRARWLDMPQERGIVINVETSDDPMLLKSLRETLAIDGHDVVVADGGQAGIDAFVSAHRRGEPFTVVLTDLGMPYVDGQKVAAAVKGVVPGTPVIMVTGWGQRMQADKDLPAHVDGIVSKPPKLSELRRTLAELSAP